jgi:hypothetical protein
VPYTDVDEPGVTIEARRGVCRNKGVFYDDFSGDVDMTISVLQQHGYYQQIYIVEGELGEYVKENVRTILHRLTTTVPTPFSPNVSNSFL